MVVLRCKVVLVGDAAVGKTALTQVFQGDASQFPKTYAMTAGVDLIVKTVGIPETKDAVELFIFDTAGHEVYSDIVSRYWTDASAVMVVYDMTNKASFENAAKWYDRVRKTRPDGGIGGILVGTKKDLEEVRVVKEKAAKEFAKSKNLKYFEVSAMTQVEVDAPFVELAEMFYHNYEEKIQRFKGLV
eukprot:Opistho-1_new@62661